MVIEESSVVAAACKAAKFWRNKGGFKTSIISLKKLVKFILFLKGTNLNLKNFLKKTNQNFSKIVKKFPLT